MPLSRTKQAEYMREYRKSHRYNVIPNASIINHSPVIPNKAKIEALRTIIKEIETDSTPKAEIVIPNQQPIIYRPGMKPPAPGTLVRVALPNGKLSAVMPMPELDSEGQPVPEY